MRKIYKIKREKHTDYEYVFRIPLEVYGLIEQIQQQEGRAGIESPLSEVIYRLPPEVQARIKTRVIEHI